LCAAAGALTAARFVAYYRVSTDKQGRSGLGLEAQREAVSRHVASAAGTVIDEFEEIESGKKNDRPKIAAALGACRARRATLIIAKLDRLARNVAFVSNLMESDVDFVACDNPFATRLTILILAAVAEHERESGKRSDRPQLAAALADCKKLKAKLVVRAGYYEAQYLKDFLHARRSIAMISV
jgi:DNA invertase Pin-like site-specific DNA recombinase